MSGLDWEREKVRRKRDLVKAAAGDLPRTITARFQGQCHVCKLWWKPGAKLARTTADAWAHALCATEHNAAADAASRLADRRQRLKATREPAAH